MKKTFTTLITLLLLTATMAFSQAKVEKEQALDMQRETTRIIQQTNVKVLTQFGEEAAARFETNRALALKIAEEKGWVVRKDTCGILQELMGVTPDSIPLYFTTFNVAAAKSTRANTLNNGGLLGLDLDGQNMTAHVWDGGLARKTHQEYDGPGGDNRFSIGDGTTTTHYHSAHVTGTIIASGVVASAKGMAPQAKAVGYEWTNDVSEATSAASNGMIISNHSYGYGAAQLPDAQFGQYGTDASNWDKIMYNAPYYLMVVAAGNDGDDNTSNASPLDGNSSYDKLSGHATSKNNLVVANANDASIDASGNLQSVTINSSSSEGPTDDYRIKPDITGNGTGVYSTYESSDKAYESITGTSMASPNVAGTLLLLQQHYKNLNGELMRAATLKGVALHTADDISPAGPDAVHGWGLLNAKRAAQLISGKGVSSIVDERTLTNGASYSIDVRATGSEPLMASLSWTDPAGTAKTGTNDKTPALVNDLDIRITQSSDTYYPYRLKTITANEKADNNVDPYERVDIASPSAEAIYTITITHKGSLSATQNYSLIVSGVALSTDEPVVSTANVTNITTSSATSGGNVIEQGLTPVTERGIVWSVNANPTTSDNKITAGSGLGTFTANITGLTSATTYNVRAYAINSNGISYGDNKSFSTSLDPEAPVSASNPSPINNQQNVTTNGTLTWTWGANTENYDLWFGPAGAMTKVVTSGVAGAEGTQGSYAYSALNASTTYEWQVISYKTSEGPSADGSKWDFTTGCGSISSFPYQIGFEEGALPACWSYEGDAWEYQSGGGYMGAPSTAHSGKYNAYFYSESFFDAKVSKLVSPSIDLSATETSTLTFWYAQSQSGFGTQDGLRVYYKTSAAGTWTKIAEYTSSIANWTQETLTLPNASGDYYIAFEATGQWGYGVVLDDVEIDIVSAGPTYDVTFTVTDSKNGRPVDNASISINSTTLTTDLDGVATTQLTNGSYPYTINKTGYDEKTGTVTVSNAAVNENVKLTASSATEYTLTFTVTDSKDGRPVDNASISINSTTLTTDLDGVATTQLPNGSYAYTVSKEGFTSVTGSTTIADANKTEPITLVVPTYDVTFTVMDSTDVRPVDNASISINSTTLTTDIDGVATTQLPNGSYPYTINKTGYDEKTGTVTVSGAAVNENVTFVKTPIPEYTLTFQVKDGNSQAVQGASVNINFITLTTDASGEATIELPNGSYSYTVSKEGFTSVNGSATIANANKTEPITLVVPTYAVTFNVTDFDNSQAINGASISINSTAITTNASGTATIQLPYGSYPYTINKTGYDEKTGTITVSNAAVNENVKLVKASASKYTLTFDVKDNASQAVQGASIEVNGTTLTTNASGVATIQLGNGDYAYTVSKAGFTSVTGSTTIANANKTENITLAIPNYTVTFKVTDLDNSQAVVGASITINGSTLTTNASGVATVQLPNGNYPYTVNNAGYNDETGSVIVSGAAVNENVKLVKTPAAKYTLTFNVKDNASQAVQGASIEVNGTTLTTNASGVATIQLGNGDYAYTVSKAGFTSVNGSATIANANKTENITLAIPNYTVTFKVTDFDNSQAVNGASISINSTTLTTNASGVATVQLPNGNYPYTVNNAGYNDETGSVIVSSAAVNENVKLVKTPATKYTLTFQVKNADSQPVQSASVEINGTTLTTNASGVATIQLGNGNYMYTVSKAGFTSVNGSATIANANKTENVTLTIPGYTVTFNVTDIANSQAVGGASVTINGSTLTTNAGGAATIGLTNGTYTYTVTKAGYNAVNGSVTVSGAAVNENVKLVKTPAAKYTLTFNVKDGENQAVQGASVEVNGSTLTTNASGVATIELVNGNYSYVVSKAGYTSVNSSATVADGDKFEYVTLTIPNYTVNFSVADNDNSQAINGASITINSTTLTTNASGVATVQLPNGSYPYTVNKAGYNQQSNTIIVSGAGVNENVKLSPTKYTLTFEVKNADSQPVQSASVEINGTTLATNASGVASIQLANGNYGYTVSKAGFTSVNGSATIANANKTEPITLVVPTYDVTFTVTDSKDGRPVDNASISINSTTLTTGIDGVATTQLPNGSYPYTINKTGYDEKTGTVTVSGAAENENVTFVKTPIPEYTLTFQVKDGNSQAVQGASVNINLITLTTDASGEATIELPNGSYPYTVSKEGFTSVNGSTTIADANKTEPITLVVPTYAVTFNVTDFDNSQAINGASITINSTTLTTNASGVATVQLPNGNYPYTVNNAGYNVETATVTVSNAAVNENVKLVKASASKYTLTFDVKDNASQAVQGASIEVNGTTLTTNASGEATIELPNGSYPYTVSKEGFTSVTGSTTIADANKTEPITLVVPTYDVTFNVTDSKDERPVDNASISINSTTLITDLDGVATTQLPNGSYPYTINKTGYDEKTGTITVSNAAVNENVKLVKASASKYTLTFDVKDNASQAVQGASIEVNGTTLTTNASGVATIQLGNGDYAYTVSKAGFTSVTGSAVIADIDITETVTLDIPSYTVTFKVTDGNEKAIVGAAIVIDETHNLITDITGMATIKLVDGTYSFTLTKEGFDGLTSTFTVNGESMLIPISISTVGFETELLSAVKAYPNPFTNQITIDNASGVKQIVISNLIGQRVMEIDLNGAETKTIFTDKLINGVYLVTLKTNKGQVVVKKMVKQ